MDYDDRALRGILNRIAHALEAIARSTDPNFRTAAETKAEPETSTGPPAGKGANSPSRVAGEPWVRPRKGFINRKR
jgi:hypothetical protein